MIFKLIKCPFCVKCDHYDFWVDSNHMEGRLSGSYINKGYGRVLFERGHCLYGIAFIDDGWDPWYINDKSLVAFKKGLL